MARVQFTAETVAVACAEVGEAGVRALPEVIGGEDGVEAVLRDRSRRRLMLEGVSSLAPETTMIALPPPSAGESGF